MQTQFLKPTQIEKAVQLLKDKEVVAVPTETVYGLAADATEEDAIVKIFQAKQRPIDHPLIVHIESFEKASEWALEIPEIAKDLAKAFWPGPLTMIFKKKSHVSNLLTAGMETVALRVPNHPLTLEIIKKLGHAIAAPSANMHKKTSPTSPEHVLKTLDGKISAVIDGGTCNVGLESTILDMTKEIPEILRPGAITASMIQKVIGSKVIEKKAHSEKVAGNMAVHYQPEKPLFIMSLEEIQSEIKANSNVAVVHYDHINDLFGATSYKMPSEKAAYSQALYQTLYTIDQSNVIKILVQTPPSSEEWNDVNDRLEKARWK